MKVLQPLFLMSLEEEFADAHGHREERAKLKRLLKKGYVRDDSWSWTVSAWVYPSYSAAGGWTQSLASITGQIQQKCAYAYRSNILYFDADKTALKRK